MQNSQIKDWHLLSIGTEILVTVPRPNDLDSTPNKVATEPAEQIQSRSIEPPLEPASTPRLLKPSENGPAYYRSDFVYGQSLSEKPYLRGYSYYAASLKVDAGVLNGINLSFETVPYHLSSVNKDIQYGFGRDRWSLGYEIAFEGISLIDKLSIVPRVQVFQLDGQFPVETSSQQVYERKVKLVPQAYLRLLVGVTLNYGVLTFNPWIEAGPTKPSFPGKAEQAITSLQGGVRFLHTAYQTSKWELGYLIFARHEQLHFSARKSEAFEEERLLININQNFVGAGLHLGVK